MYLSLNWLKDYVDIPSSMSPEELGSKLTMHTFEVEAMLKESDKYKNVVVGKVLEAEKHPNADKLKLAKIEVGDGRILDIVCGAPNLEKGQYVPVALPGACLPSGLEIREAEIRGHKSCGMVCAEDELGLGDDHAGIMVLENCRVGQAFGDYLKLKDILIEVDNKTITHRPDLWGHVGMAREIAVCLGTKTTKQFEKVNGQKIKLDTKNIKISVKVDDYELCPRYMAVAMDGVKVEPSPKWLREKLIAVGAKPINNIVDVTNYVMLEMGQPLHAFDRAEVSEVVVRLAKKGEKMKTLDGDDKQLSAEDLVITDGKKPVAIAGVKGGENSGINENTVSILIESANFNPVSVRKTSQRLDLRTEASARFEKSLDPNLCEIALARAIELVKKVCPAAKTTGLADEKKFKLNQGPIELDLNWLSVFIGQKMEAKKVKNILSGLGFEVVEKKNDILSVTVPTWRATKDISIKQDLAEEVVRIIGYDNLPASLPVVSMTTPIKNEERMLERKIKQILAYGGQLSEVQNHSFVGEEQLKKLGADLDSYIRLANPISATYTMLRQNLAPHLIDCITKNQAKFDNFGMFEFGSVFHNISGDLAKNDKNSEKLPYQEKRIGIVLAGGREDLFAKVKGIVSNLMSYLNLEAVYNTTEMLPAWADGQRAARVSVNNVDVGIVYMFDAGIIRKAGVKKAAAMAELNFKEIFNQAKGFADKKFQAFEKYPPAVRDLAFVVNEKVLYNDIKDEINNFHGYIKEVELFDEYHGGKLGEDNKSMAFHIVYQAEKTMTREEVDEIQTNLIKKLEKKFDAKVRNF